jgi:two-component system sensor histidine kinase HydH
VIAKNIRFLEHQMMANGYAIRTVFDGEIPVIMADGDMLYQAFLNLLINGMQAMPGGGTIEVTIETGDDNLWLYIEDEGDGVSSAVIGKDMGSVFSPRRKRAPVWALGS